MSELKENKILYGLIALAVFATIFTGTLALKSGNPKVATAPPSEDNLGASFDLSICLFNDNKTATTSFEVIRSTATTTMTCNTQFATLLDLNINLTASSSASSVLLWNYEFSDNGIDYFGQDAYTGTNNTTITHGATITTHKWSPGQTATSTKNVQVDPVATRWTRVNFQLDSGGGMIWAKLIKREPIR